MLIEPDKTATAVATANHLIARPENAELSESSIEDLCVSLSKLKDINGRSVSILPLQVIFTEEALRRFFGWTDEDIKLGKNWPC